MDLIDLLKRSESKTLEFKRDLSSPDGVLRTIVAFANTAGGVLLLGVEDATRNVRGVAKPLAMEERLANLISDSILPYLIPDIGILPWRRNHVLAVQVHPSPGRPHYLKSAGLEGGVYVRVGSTNRRADRELIDELRRFARAETFDEQAMPECDSEALNFRAASESFASVRKLKRADLDTLRLMMKHQGRKVPTVGGILLFGKGRWNLPPVAVREAIPAVEVPQMTADMGSGGEPVLSLARLTDIDNAYATLLPELTAFTEAPTMLVATVDKFARLAWEERANAYFGGTQHRPPELIIQDELHLIASVLGSVAGLYEAAIDTVLQLRGVYPKYIRRGTIH